jgi:hypothetical protein
MTDPLKDSAVQETFWTVDPIQLSTVSRSHRTCRRRDEDDVKIH